MATVKIIPLKHRKLKDGLYPIYLRIIHERVKKEYSTGLKCLDSDYDFEKCKYKRNRSLNEKVLKFELKAVNVINRLADDFHFNSFEEQLFKKRESNSIYADMSDMIIDLELEDRIGTAKTYLNTRNSFAHFLNIRSLKFIQLQHMHVIQYLNYMTAKGLSKATIGIYLRTLKAAYNKVVVDPNKHPFKGVRIPTGNKGKLSLSKNQLLKLYEFQTEDCITRRSIDWFMLSYLCRGMNFSDLTRLKYSSNILNNRIEYMRKKTKRSSLNDITTGIPINSMIVGILNRYKHNSDFVLPVLVDGLTAKNELSRVHRHLKIINKKLKEVSKEIGIPEWNKVTFYCARHSYANTLSEANVNLNVISKGLGHTSIRTTENYLSSIRQDVIDSSDSLLV